MAKGEVLSLERFLPTDDKAKLVLLHPVMPWVLVVDKAENLVVWDWKKAETLLSANMAGPNEQALIEHGIQLKAEADEAYFGPQTSKRTDVTTSQKPGGRVRGAAFLDAHVAYWTAALGISAMQGPVAPQADSSATTALRAGRWLAVACENKLVILSLLTKRVRELHRADLENKAIHSLAVLVGAGEMGGSKKAPRQMLRNEPLLALGCSDGVIRVLSWMTLQVVARLVQGHTRAVTCLQPLASQTPGGPELLVSGDAGGSIALWEPPSGRSVSPRGPGAPLEVEPKTTIDKAQPDQVEQMALLFPPLAPGAQELQRPRLVTRGSEGRVTVRDAGNLHEMYQGSPLEPMKAKCNGMSACSRAMVADRHAPALLLCAYGSATVLGMHPISGAVRPLGSVDGLIPVPKGKKPKLYGLCAHPTRPHILAAATNAGLALLAFRDGMPLPVAPLPPSMDVAMQPQDTAAAGNTPLTSPSASAVSSPGVTKSRTMTYLAAHEGKLLSLRYRVKSGKKAATVAAVPPPVVLEMQEVVEVATLLQGAAACTISFSPNGALLAVCWPGTGSYVVMGRGLSPGEWLEGEHGSASQVAWHSKRNMLAVLEEPGMDHMLLRAQAAAGGAGAGMPSVAHNAVVRLKVFDSTLPHGREAVCMNFPDRPPRALFGGALLGIVRRQQESVATSVAAVTGLDSKLPPPMLQLYGWDTAAPLGPEVPAPVWVAWEPGNEMVALGYADSVVIYSLYDGFYPLADLALPETTGGLWDRRQLFVISPSTVSAVFVIPLLEPEGIAATGDPLLQLRQGVHHEALVQVLRIAGLEGGGAGMGGLEEEGTAMGLPPPLVRPAGPCVLMGLRGPFLWLADSHSRAHALPLLHAGVKARMEAARGDLVMARIAADALPMKATDDVARILAAAALTAGEGVATGVAEALAVSWLSLTSELFLAIQGGQLKRALWCLFSLVEGCLDRSLVEASPCWELRLEAAPLGSPSGAPGRAGLDDLVASGGAGSTQYAKVGSNWLGGGRADEENEALYRMIQEEAAAADAGHPDRAAGDVAAEDAARLAAAADFTGAEGEDEAGDAQQPAAPWVEIDWDAPLKSPGTPFTSLTTATPAPAGADPVPSAGGWRRGGVTAGGSSSTAPTQLSAMSDLPQLPHNETALLLHPHQQSQILALAMQLVDAALGRGERAVARLALAALTRSVDHGLLKLTPGLMARLHRAGMQKHLERLLQPGKARRHDPVTLALGAVLLSKPQALDVLETCAGEGGSLLLTPLAALAAPAAYEPADGGMLPLDRWIRLLNSDATVSAAAASDEAYLDALEPVQVVPPGMG